MEDNLQKSQEGGNDGIDTASSNVISKSTAGDSKETATGMIPENLNPTTSFSKAPTMVKILKVVCELSATEPKPRPPPSPTKTEHVRLLTIGPSHYCEKVRWGFDLLESDPDSPFYYTEDPYPPLFHSFFTSAASRGEASMVPMVVGNNNSECLYDSTKILKRFCPFLYPADIDKEVDELEQMFDSQLGPAVRCVIYYHFLSSPQPKQHLPKLADILTRHASNKVHKALFRTMLTHSNQMKQGFLRSMNVNSETAKQAEQEIHSIFAKVSDRLLLMEEKNSDSGTCSKQIKQYLCCDRNNEPRFTAADLAFAALASPLIMPKELFSFYDDDPDTTPAHLINLSNELRQTCAGQHVMTIYHRHRFGVRQLPSEASCAAANTVVQHPSDHNPTNTRVVVPKCTHVKSGAPSFGCL